MKQHKTNAHQVLVVIINQAADFSLKVVLLPPMVRRTSLGLRISVVRIIKIIRIIRIREMLVGLRLSVEEEAGLAVFQMVNFSWAQGPMEAVELQVRRRVARSKLGWSNSRS